MFDLISFLTMFCFNASGETTSDAWASYTGENNKVVCEVKKLEDDALVVKSYEVLRDYNRFRDCNLVRRSHRENASISTIPEDACDYLLGK